MSDRSCAPAYASPSQTFGSRAFGLAWRIVDLAARSIPAVLEVWAQRARTRQQLESLDSHLLRDIGLTRHDVVLETKKRFWEA
jgi:uncharacterized protein YjiS (DUF1127 family)